MRVAALLAAAAATLTACAPLPPAPAPAEPPTPPSRAPQARPAPPPDASPRAAAIARHAKLARAAQASGDLAAAVDHHEVLVLLDPGNPAHRAALKATQQAVDEDVQSQLRAAAAARKAGEATRAREAWLRVLVLDPTNADAERGLRELEQQAMARTQADRAARARSMDEVVANARARASAAVAVENYADLEQRIELVRSADASIALREARDWAEENPGDRAGRVRLAAALSERARELDGKGQREWALPLYDQAAKLGGATQTEAGRKAATLRRALADEAYAEGMRARNTDLAAAIRHWENALRIDPQHPRARDRLREGRAAQQKLERITK